MSDGKILQRYQPYSPSTPADYPGVAPTINAEALDAVAALANYQSNRQVYVDAVNGSDVTGTGAQLRPYQTIEAAFAAIALLPVGAYAVMLAPGTYGTGPIAWPVIAGQNISVFGSGDASISVPITYTSIGGVSEESIIMHGIGITDMTVDFTAAAAKVAQITIINCGVGINRIDTLPAGPQTVRIFDSFITSASTSATMLIVNGQWVGGPNNAIAATGQMLVQSSLAAAMVYDIAAGGQLLIEGSITSFSTFNVDGTLTMLGSVPQGATIGGAGNLIVDAASLSFAPTVTIATTTLADNAQNVGFAPAVPANWVAPPTEVAGALDELASRVSAGVTPLTNTFYVDGAIGNDVSGNGSIGQPYATIQKAATEIGAAASNADFNDAAQRYYVVNVSPGVYTESPTFGTRPFIQLNMDAAQIVGDLTVQFDQGAIFGAGLQSPQFIINGKAVRPIAGGSAVVGVTGDLVYESIGSGSSLVARLEIFRCGIQGDVIQQLGTGGGTFTLTSFISSSIVTGTIQNNSGAGSHTLYADNCDDSSSNSIGGVNGVVNLNVLSSVRFTGIVDVNSSQSGRWNDVSFAAVANDFTGSSGSIRMDANSYQSYFANVPTKGAETASLSDNARGVAYSPATPADWVAPPDQVAEALDELAARPAAAGFVKEIGVVSAPQAAAKQIDLGALADHASVVFTVVGLTGLVDTISYQLTDAVITTIDWNGLGLDGVLLAGADYQIQYLPA